MSREIAKRAPVSGRHLERVRRLGAVSLLSLAVIAGAVMAQPAMQPEMDVMPMPSEPLFVADEVIVKFKEPIAGVSALGAELQSSMALPDAERLTSGGEQILKLVGAQGMGIMEAGAPEADRVMEAVERLNARDDVEYAQPNWVWQHFAVTPDDPRYPEQWHYFTQGSGSGQVPGGIGLPERWAETTGDPNVTVAVIDTGILPDHPDISGSPNLGAGYDMISSTFIANDGDGRDADPTDPGDAISQGECGQGYPPRDFPSSWHGTHVAGTIGVGKTNNGDGVAGINWQARILPVRVLGKCGGTTADINDAIRWAAGLSVPGVPNNPQPAQVINLSLGGTGTCSSSPATQSAINDAVAAGTTVVVAAGNSARDVAGYTPAGCDGVITVAASDYRGRLVTRYSNFGTGVEIMAPGGDVSQDANGDGNDDGVLSMVQGGYALYNGTSMAAPHVAGVAALLLAEEPNLTPDQVLQRLQASALPRDSTECPKPCGAGLLSTSEPAPDKLMLRVDRMKVGLEAEQSASIVATVMMAGAPKSDVPVEFASQGTGVVTVKPATGNTNAEGRVAATLTAAGVGGPVCVNVSTGDETVCVEVTVTQSGSGMSLWSLGALVAFMLGWLGWRGRSLSRA